MNLRRQVSRCTAGNSFHDNTGLRLLPRLLKPLKSFAVVFGGGSPLFQFFAGEVRALVAEVQAFFFYTAVVDLAVITTPADGPVSTASFALEPVRLRFRLPGLAPFFSQFFSILRVVGGYEDGACCTVDTAWCDHVIFLHSFHILS
jgi:hypothetical protein